MGSLLVLALGTVGFLQTRQFELLNSTRSYQDDYMIWSLFQFEAESMRLRLLLEQAQREPQHTDVAQIEQRYEIFVSRLGLIESEHATVVLRSHPDYLQTLQRSKDFVAWADALPMRSDWLKQQSMQDPPGPGLGEAARRLGALSSAIQELSLTASHHVAKQVDERNHLVREQARLSLWLTALQCGLTLGFAALVLRQFRRLDQYGREQHALADRLQGAQREAEAGSRAKSVFLANMSHELRTPMHGLLGMLDLLKDTPLNPAQQSQLQAAHDSSHHLLAVLNDILDVSKMEAGGIKIQAEPVQLSRLLHELEELSRPQARAKNLALTLRLQPQLPAYASADPTRLRQILLNLLSNAIKFSEQGQVSLSLSEAEDENGQPRLCCEVSDTGIGMDAATQVKLFQRFSQGDATHSRRFGGAGLGLEISRNLARAMGGDITVRSELGQGSVFTVDLPLLACEPQTAARPAAAPALQDQRRLRILVSEDHATNQAYLQAVLDRLGHQAVFCVNGLQALHRLQDQDFDLVLMDLHTPVMDGFAAARAIRQLTGPKAAVRIIALSADAFDESRALALEAGMNEFLAKPLSIEALASVLDRCARELAPTGMPTQSEEPRSALNEQVLKDLRDLLPAATVRQLYASFVDSLPASRQALQTSLHKRDARGLREAAHSLKGAAANLGLQTLSEAAHALEQAARSMAAADGTDEDPDGPALDRLTRELLAAVDAAQALCRSRDLV